MDLVLINERLIAVVSAHGDFITSWHDALREATLLTLDCAYPTQVRAEEYRLVEAVWNPAHIASVLPSSHLLRQTRNGVAQAWLKRRYREDVGPENAFERFAAET